MQDHNCGLVHERARETVAASRDVSTAIRLARLVAAGRETEMRTHRSRSRKTARGFKVLTYNSEERGPIPGTVISRRQIGSALTCCSTALSKTAICWRSCRHVASRGRTRVHASEIRG